MAERTLGDRMKRADRYFHFLIGLLFLVGALFLVGSFLSNLPPKGDWKVKVTDQDGNDYWSNDFQIDEQRDCVTFTDHKSTQRAWCNYPTRVTRLK